MVRLSTNSELCGPTGGVDGPQAAMGRGERPDAGQAPMRRGGNTSRNRTSDLVRCAAAALGAPNNVQGAGRRREDPGNVARDEPVNISCTWTEEER